MQISAVTAMSCFEHCVSAMCLLQGEHGDRGKPGSTGNKGDMVSFMFIYYLLDNKASLIWDGHCKMHLLI